MTYALMGTVRTQMEKIGLWTHVLDVVATKGRLPAPKKCAPNRAPTLYENRDIVAHRVEVIENI